jgi:hypothetical protein
MRFFIIYTIIIGFFTTNYGVEKFEHEISRKEKRVIDYKNALWPKKEKSKDEKSIPVEKTSSTTNLEKDQKENPSKDTTVWITKMPPSMKLFYRGKKEHYAVFYDLNGHEVYFRYRVDKFDEKAEAKLTGLFPGHGYQVSGKFIGVILFKDIISGAQTGYENCLTFGPNKYLDCTETKIELGVGGDKDTIPLYEIEAYEPLYFKEVIY